MNARLRPWLAGLLLGAVGTPLAAHSLFFVVGRLNVIALGVVAVRRTIGDPAASARCRT